MIKYTSMRILCVCAGGNTRSVTLATLLKYHYGNHDALACSIEKNKAETLDMLFQWANLVIAVDKAIFKDLANIPGIEDKITLVDIGQDKWGMSMHHDLIPLACKLLEEKGFKSAKQWDAIIAQRSKYELRRKADNNEQA